MTKRSAYERRQRAAERERVAEIDRAWHASLPAEVATRFREQVEAARSRGPLPPPPDMAPGTAPNPPAPGREPKPKAEPSPRRGRR